MYTGFSDLNDPRIMSSKEAINKWGIDDSTLRKRITEFPDGTIRKLGRDWVVIEDGMIWVFGPNMIEEEIDMSKLQSTLQKVESMAAEKGLSVKKFPHLTNHAVLVGGTVLVWLDNLHWKELKFGGNDYKSRDYGGKYSLDEKFEEVSRELMLRKEKLDRGIRLIDKYTHTDETVENFIKSSIKKKAK